VSAQRRTRGQDVLDYEPIPLGPRADTQIGEPTIRALRHLRQQVSVDRAAVNAANVSGDADQIRAAESQLVGTAETVLEVLSQLLDGMAERE